MTGHLLPTVGAGPAERGGVWVTRVRTCRGAGEPCSQRRFSTMRTWFRTQPRSYERAAGLKQCAGGGECEGAGNAGGGSMRSSVSPALAEHLGSARLIASRSTGYAAFTACARCDRSDRVADQRSVMKRLTMAKPCATISPAVATIRTTRISITTFNFQNTGSAPPTVGCVPATRTLVASSDNSMGEGCYLCD
jgi:hypothetical protein